MRSIRKFVLLFLVIGFFAACQKSEPSAISFNRDIRPILNKNCLACHGGVKKLGDFSLLFEEEAFAVTESGKKAIIKGDHQASELYKRLISKDHEERMPQEAPPLSSPKEIKLIAQWIDEGAQWETHWAYVKPDPSIRPPTDGGDWVRNEIDHFIFDKLGENNLTPSEEASKINLVRRVYLDLIGIPPSLEQANSFLENSTPNAYEDLVDTLLASEHFGEHWAAMWMDLARYGDSQGYQKDPIRWNIWRYRDWVIDAFNRDLPFDQFTIEQLAGDLLENPTNNQLLATAFHRNTNTNDEGGTDNEEFRVRAVLDRINTTMEVWQGTTIACVQCHSHPYDPFKHEEYYQLYAFFNNTQDADLPSEEPKAMLLSPAQERTHKKLVSNLEVIKRIGDTLSKDYIEKIEQLASIKPAPVPVMKELVDSNRVNAVFEKGNWLVHGKEVEANVPASLPVLNTSKANRLDLAKWLVSPENPLTARVTVNRFWSIIFGKGIVETVEDFGTQGSPPSHPELLDWLSVQFQNEMNWSVKSLLREIVLSATYRQSSKIDELAIQTDPNNVWLSRAPRVRLSAEQIRDQALVVSGLFNPKVYGPSVMPPQPDGVWNVIRHITKWETSKDGDQHRRGLYTFWRKTSPYPSMISFDSPSRELCVSRRVLTNTPLQSLITLNDPVFVEASEALAIKMLDFEGNAIKDKIGFGYESALFKKPEEEKLLLLEGFYKKAIKEYEEVPEAKAKLINYEEKSTELAAMINVANVILNLDEFLMKH